MPKFSRPTAYTGRVAASSKITGQVRFANQVETDAGISDDLAISPLTLANSIDTLAPHATTAIWGVVRLTDNSDPIATKLYADNLAIAGAPAWSETVSGIGQLATTAEALAGTNDNTAITPLKLAQVIAAGGPASFTNVTISGTLDVAGLTTLSGSATVVTGATALNLGADASTGAVNIGTGAGARAIVIGNTTTTTGVTVNTGTAHFTVNTTGTGDIILNSDDTMLLDADGVLELNSSAGVISIGNDADSQNINIGTAGARTITLGNSTGTTSLVLDAGTGAINIGTNAIAHSITLGNSDGATTIVLDAGTGPINIGTNAIAHNVTIGNVIGTSAVAINTGTGGFALATTGAGTITAASGSTLLLDAVGALELNSSAGVISVGNDAVSQNINVGTAGTRAIAIGNSTATTSIALDTGTGNSLNLGTNAIAHVVTIGNVIGTTGVTINSGTAGVAINTTGTGDFVVTSADTVLIDSAGVLELNSSAGVIGIGNDAVSQNINIGTAGTRVITIGNTTTTTGIAITSGTGDITLGSEDAIELAATGLIELNSSGAAINIGNNNDPFAVNIGTSAGAARTITIGNGFGATSVVLSVGTGALTLGSAATQHNTTLGSTTGTSTTTINGGTGGVNVAGNLNLSSVATKLSYNGGAATDFIGLATLVAGTVTVANTNIAATDRIFMQHKAVNASTALGILTYTINAGVGFTITSMGVTTATVLVADVSDIVYVIVGQN